MFTTESYIVAYKNFVDIMQPKLKSVSTISLFNKFVHFAYTVICIFSFRNTIIYFYFVRNFLLK